MIISVRVLKNYCFCLLQNILYCFNSLITSFRYCLCSKLRFPGKSWSTLYTRQQTFLPTLTSTTAYRRQMFSKNRKLIVIILYQSSSKHIQVLQLINRNIFKKILCCHFIIILLIIISSTYFYQEKYSEKYLKKIKYALEQKALKFHIDQMAFI